MFHHLNNKGGSRPRYVKAILHACSLCGKEGLRPGFLETKGVRDGVRELASKKFTDLILDENGVCETCRNSQVVQKLLNDHDA